MKQFKKLSFRTQIFLSSLIVIVLPSVLLSAFAANKRSEQISMEYNTSTAAILTQMNQSIDTLLQNASKIADTPLLNDEARIAMITNYGDDYLGYAQGSYLFRNLMRQTNRLNSELMTCVFQNRYGYSFEYNVHTAQHQRQIEENITKWADIARNTKNHMYFARLSQSDGTGYDVIPMVKILLDGYDYREIGICYCEINFKPIMEILESSRDTENTLLIYNADNELTYSTNSNYLQNPEEYRDFLSALSEFANTLEDFDSITTDELSAENKHFAVNGCINSTTSWKLVQLVDNNTISHLYRDTNLTYIKIFLLTIFLGLLLAAFLSRFLTKPVSRLCHDIDALNPEEETFIDEKACGGNQELQKLVVSFNGLNQRLKYSLQNNYEIQLSEQQMKVQMLQFQINHHFLYNTLNVIKSLAKIHKIPEIETISMCMSDLIRYNLENFPVARLEEELMQIRRYMTIQNIRFPDKFYCDINIPAAFLKMEIPAFLLQPLVENSIEHGFADRETNCYISISCQLEQNTLHFLVADNGSGIPSARLSTLQKACREDTPDRTEENGHHSIGIRNVSQRLRSYYGEQYGLSIESVEGEGTIIDAMLPASALKE